MSDDFLNDTLSYSNAKRKQLLQLLEEENGNKPPTDKDGAKLFLNALKDMDSSAIGHARVKTEEKQADNGAIVAQTVRDFARVYNGTNPFEAGELAPGTGEHEIPEEIAASVTVPDSVKEQGKVTETVDQFSARTSKAASE